MRHLVLALCLVASATDAQTVSAADLPTLPQIQANASISALQGGAILLGAAVAGVGGLVLASNVDSATFTLVSYPVVTAAGAYAAGRLIRADGSLFGALAGGVVGAVPGYLIILVDEPSEDALIDVSYTGLMAFLIGPPIGAAIGYYVVPAVISGFEGGAVPGGAIRIQF